MLRASNPVQLVLGPIIWALWFVAIYAILSVVCNTASPEVEQGAATGLNAVLLALTLLVTLLLSGFSVWCWRASRQGSSREVFFSRVAAGVYLITAVSTLLIGVPAAVLPPCL